MDGDPERAVREVLAGGFPDTAPRTVERAAWGNTKHTALVTLADGREVVVQYSETAALRTEAALLSAVGAQTEVPVPAVLAVVDQGPGTALVTARVPGASLHERFESLAPERRRALAATLGSYLATLHDAFPFEGYGAVAADGVLGVADPATDWRAWLRGYAETGAAALAGPLAEFEAPVREALAEAIPSLRSAPRACLFPWDFRPGNVVVHGDAGVAAVLDWGDPLSAAAPLSLAKAEYLVADWYADPAEADGLRDAFRDGYERQRPVPRAYRRNRALYRLVGVVRSAVDARGRITQPRYPEVDADTAAAFHARHLDAALAALS